MLGYDGCNLRKANAVGIFPIFFQTFIVGIFKSLFLKKPGTFKIRSLFSEKEFFELALISCYCNYSHCFF